MNERPNARMYYIGAIAGSIAESVSYPMDSMKVRLQVQNKYGIREILKKTCQEEGLCTFYRGVHVAILRQCMYGSLRVGLYDNFKQNVPAPLAGFVAGVISNGLCTPTDLVKIKLQSDIGKSKDIVRRKYNGITSVVKNIYQTNGLRSFWRGISLTSGRAGMIALADIVTYDYIRSFLINKMKYNESYVTYFIASCFTGLCSTSVTTPIDHVKTNYLNYKHIKKYTSVINCTSRLYKETGIRGFYRGWVPTYMRLGPSTIIFFMTMEKLKTIF
jgi:hypothetical protein